MLLIVAATIINSLVSLVGMLSFFIENKSLPKIIFALVSFSAGTLLAGALLSLLPEAAAYLEIGVVSLYFLLGFILFFCIEKFLRWHHCHETGHCDTHPFTYLILIGDGVHNFIDGIIIAAAFSVNSSFGFLTTGMILVHEIPQELGDFGALVYGGMDKKKALLLNFFSQVTCVIGGIVGWFFSTGFTGFTPVLLSIAGGGFLYISASDLIPELHREADTKKTLTSFFFMMLGIIFVSLFKG